MYKNKQCAVIKVNKVKWNKSDNKKSRRDLQSLRYRNMSCQYESESNRREREANEKKDEII